MLVVKFFDLRKSVYPKAIGRTENFLLDFQSIGKDGGNLHIYYLVVRSLIRTSVDLDRNDKRETRCSRLTKPETLSRNGRP